MSVRRVGDTKKINFLCNFVILAAGCAFISLNTIKHDQFNYS